MAAPGQTGPELEAEQGRQDGPEGPEEEAD